MKAILEILIPVLIQVESHGRVDAVGDGGKAVGCLQIHEIMVDDVNRIAKMNGWNCHLDVYRYDVFTLNDRFIKDRSIRMCEYYLEYYYPKYVAWYQEHGTSQHPHPFDVAEICARLWNGGYKGLKENPRATDHYWYKVGYISCYTNITDL
jgi:hypothetical protein